MGRELSGIRFGDHLCPLPLGLCQFKIWNASDCGPETSLCLCLWDKILRPLAGVLCPEFHLWIPILRRASSFQRTPSEQPLIHTPAFAPQPGLRPFRSEPSEFHDCIAFLAGWSPYALWREK